MESPPRPMLLFPDGRRVWFAPMLFGEVNFFVMGANAGDLNVGGSDDGGKVLAGTELQADDANVILSWSPMPPSA